MNRVTGRIRTLHAAKYIGQLCKHWAHKLTVEQAGDIGIVRFPAGVATMAAYVGELSITIDTNDKASSERLKEVVASHLDRFALREAPLPFVWTAA